MVGCPSLVELFQHVPDVRSPKGRIFPLPAVLALLVLGILLGRRSLAGIARLNRDYRGQFALLLGFRHNRTPTHAALCRILQRLDVVAFERAPGAWIQQLTRELPPADPAAAAAPAPLPVHVDGKTLRGSRIPALDLPGVHLVAAFVPRVQGVLAQVRVDAKTNEHKAALDLLQLLPPRPGGYLISGDAMFCQKDLCQAIVARSDHYVLTVKDNQPSLRTDIDAGLASAAQARTFSPEGRTDPLPPPPALKATVTEKNRGHIERRTLESTALLTVTAQWPGLQQGFRLTREITTRGKTTVEVVHGITSLPPEAAPAAALLAQVRDHWRVENQLHYVRDVTLGEDACRVRSGAAPQALAACRNVAICLFGRVSSASQAEAVQYLAARPDEAVALLLSQE